MVQSRERSGKHRRVHEEGKTLLVECKLFTASHVRWVFVEGQDANQGACMTWRPALGWHHLTPLTLSSAVAATRMTTAELDRSPNQRFYDALIPLWVVYAGG